MTLSKMKKSSSSLNGGGAEQRFFKGGRVDISVIDLLDDIYLATWGDHELVSWLVKHNGTIPTQLAASQKVTDPQSVGVVHVEKFRLAPITVTVESIPDGVKERFYENRWSLKDPYGHRYRYGKKSSKNLSKAVFQLGPSSNNEFSVPLNFPVSNSPNNDENLRKSSTTTAKMLQPTSESGDLAIHAAEIRPEDSARMRNSDLLSGMMLSRWENSSSHQSEEELRMLRKYGIFQENIETTTESNENENRHHRLQEYQGEQTPEENDDNKSLSNWKFIQWIRDNPGIFVNHDPPTSTQRPIFALKTTTTESRETTENRKKCSADFSVGSRCPNGENHRPAAVRFFYWPGANDDDVDIDSNRREKRSTGRYSRGCYKFQYQGCGGSVNTFSSKDDCERACMST